MNVNPSIISVKSEMIDTLEYQRDNADVKIEIEYFNDLGFDVIVLDRRGIQYRIPSRYRPHGNECEFRIVEFVTMTKDVQLSINENERDEDISVIQQNMLDSLSNDHRAQRITRKQAVCTKVKIDDLKNNSNIVYIKEYDIVIYGIKPNLNILHPNTVSNAISGLELNRKRVNNLEWSIKINDPHSRIGNRYINICGVVYSIHPNRDPTQMEGVILTTSSGEHHGDPVSVPMSLDVFEDKIRTYKSYEEAETYGNLETVTKAKIEAEMEKIRHENAIEESKLKSELTRLKSEAEKTKHDLETASTELKQKEIEHKRELELLAMNADREKHDRELQSLQRKSYYEERSYDRKDSSELLKFLPIIVGAGIALFFR